mmetsp:Transcript_6092/g.17051  ORF Transcript_6092/g.17051 Transcript_6092/m.17051 type:complete len:128 (+) Transcript_6092:118-501(+)
MRAHMDNITLYRLRGERGRENKKAEGRVQERGCLRCSETDAPRCAQKRLIRPSAPPIRTSRFRKWACLALHELQCLNEPLDRSAANDWDTFHNFDLEHTSRSRACDIQPSNGTSKEHVLICQEACSN